MKSLKSHISVILPILALLFSIQFMVLVDGIISEYEKQMSEDYNIIIVSQNELNTTVLKPLVANISSLEILSSKDILERLSKNISSKNISILQSALPKFYTLKLTSFPNSKQIDSIKSRILKLNGVSRVETFSKTHDKIYKILKLIKKLSQVFLVIVIIIGVMLLFKQMRIWLYEHKERIEIMSLFGAPFWLKSAVLFKIAIFDAIFAAILVVAFYYFLPSFDFIDVFEIGIKIPIIDFVSDGIRLVVIAVILAIISVSLVMRKVKRDSK